MYTLVGFFVFTSIVLLALFITERRQQVSLRMSSYLDPGSVDISPGDTAWTKFKKVALPKLGPILPAVGIADYNEKLVHAGQSGKLKGEEVYLIKIAAGLAAPLLVPIFWVAGVGNNFLAVLVFLGVLGYIFPDLWISSKIDEKKEAIDKELFSFLDILTVCTEAGLNLTDSIKKTIKYQEGALAEEFQQTLWEIETGKGIPESMTSMAHRNKSEDLEKLVHAVNQSIKRGTPISQMLKSQSKHMRELRRTKAQEMAQKANVKILVPVVACVLLPLLIIIGGPAFFNLMQIL